MELRLKVFRFDPLSDSEPRYQMYTVEAQPEERILDCLNRIKWEQDGTLSYRMSCGHGVCGSDAVRINGRCALACQTLVKDCTGPEILLEPLPFFRVLKDLIVDMEPFFDRVRRMRPYLVNPEPPPAGERRQDAGDSKKLDRTIRCILCACCMGACPVLAGNPNYVGPTPLVWAFRFIFDSRDRDMKSRLDLVDHPDGIWSCTNQFECTRVCPKEIPVTRCINKIKHEIQERRQRTGRDEQ